MKKREGFILVEIALAIAFVGAALGSMVQMFSVAANQLNGREISRLL